MNEGKKRGNKKIGKIHPESDDREGLVNDGYEMDDIAKEKKSNR